MAVERPRFGSALNDAVHYDNTQLALELLAAGADPHAPSPENGSEAIHFAAQQGDEEVIRALLAMGVDINKPNHRGETPMFFAPQEFRAKMRELGAFLHGSLLNDAIADGHTERALQLLEDGANPRKRCPERGSQAIHFAAAAGNEKLIRALAAMGVDINTPNRHGERPVDLALASACTALLHELGAVPVHGSLLNNALAGRKHDLAMQLLNCDGVDLHARDRMGNLCTHFAAQAGFADLLIILLQRGVSINERNWKQQQVDFFADTTEVKAAIKQLREESRCKSSDGTTSMDEASPFGSLLNEALYAHNFELAHQLLESGADPLAEYADNGSQAIHFAAQAGSLEMIKALVARGISINSPNRRGERPIEFVPCSDQSHAQLKRELCALGASNYGSKLNDALAAGHCVEALVLLQSGTVDLWARDPENGALCIHFAAHWFYQADILEMLVERGVSINERSWHGWQVDAWARDPATINVIGKLRRRIKQRRVDITAWATENAAQLQLPLPVLRIVLAYWRGE